MKVGAKQCFKCRKQGLCLDSRQTEEGHVRRRYKCLVKGCKERWTTFEYRVNGADKHANTTSLRFLQGVKTEGAEEAKHRARDVLKEVLGI